jgi:uncharacterized Zn-binding protein involved in type VI secretion
MGSKKPAARVGDQHECPKDQPKEHVGGPIKSGSPNVFINGKPAARVGDPLGCEDGSTDTITEGSSNVFINGKPAARLGDATDHGGKISEGSPNVFIGTGGTSNVHFGSKGRIHIGKNVHIGGFVDTAELFDEQIQFKTDEGDPMANVAYTLTLDNGRIVSGITDEKGLTRRIRTKQPVQIEKAEFRDNDLFCCKSGGNEHG